MATPQGGPISISDIQQDLSITGAVSMSFLRNRYYASNPQYYGTVLGWDNPNLKTTMSLFYGLSYYDNCITCL